MELGSPGQPHRHEIRPLAQKAGFGGAHIILQRRCRKRGTLSIALSVNILTRLAHFKTGLDSVQKLKKCPTKVSRFWPAPGQWHTSFVPPPEEGLWQGPAILPKLDSRDHCSFPLLD